MLKSMTGFGRAKYEVNSREYIIDMKSVNNRYSDISIKMPRSISFLEEKVKQKITSVISRGKIDNFINMRKKEGKKIQEDLENRILFIEQNVNNIDNISAGLVQEYIVKLEKRINEILKNNMVDESRLAQEVVIYSDKCSVEEELTRLKSHIIQFKDLLNSNNATGKKIDFLIQEMNRETNTIGSKANCLDITNKVVDIKTILEDIREQTQNIE